jgi:hypothetical protein
MKHSNTWFALILIASVLLLSAVNGGSQNPSSGPSKKVNPPQNQRHRERQKTGNQPSPSACPSPCVYFIQTVPAPNPSQQKGHDDGDKSSPDWWIVYLTGGLVFCGFAQLIAMAVQAHYMRRGLSATDAALEIAERPYISIEIAAYTIAPPFRVDYSFTNRGRTIAWIVEDAAALIITDSEEAPELPPYQAETPRRISIGTGRTIWRWTRLESAGEEELEALRAGTSYLHFFAFVEYQDPRKTPHRSEIGALFRFKHPNQVEVTYPADHVYRGDT